MRFDMEKIRTHMMLLSNVVYLLWSTVECEGILATVMLWFLIHACRHNAGCASVWFIWLD